MMRNKPETIDAVVALNPTARFGMVDDEIQNYEPKDEQPTEEAIAEKLASMISEWEAQAYARNRASAYPAIGDQLDEIYHNGIDSWKAVIKVTKDKYPKG